MFLTAHTSVALLISTKIINPFLGFILGFISHFLIDIIPHGDEELDQKIISLNRKEKFIFLTLIGLVDLFFSLILVYFFIKYSTTNNNVIYFTVLGSWLPDILWLSIDFFNVKFLGFFIKFHTYMHTLIDYRYPIIYGIPLQIIFIVFISYFTY